MPKKLLPLLPLLALMYESAAVSASSGVPAIHHASEYDAVVDERLLTKLRALKADARCCNLANADLAYEKPLKTALAQVEGNRDQMAMLTKSGFTAREYVKGTASLLFAYNYVQDKGSYKTFPESLTKVERNNIAFTRSRLAELKDLLFNY